MDEISKFQAEVAQRIEQNGENEALRKTSSEWLRQADAAKYEYNFSWMGRPIIQYPQDIVAMQELIWRIKPELIIETGVAHGGSIIFHASMLELLGGDAMVVGIDIDIRSHNRREIEQHPMFRRINLIEGSSVDPQIVEQVARLASGKTRVLVSLDSNHTHAHVLRELELYSPFVRQGSYIVVSDTSIEDMPAHAYPDRPWKKGDNAKTAVWEFLKANNRFEIDREMENKLLLTSAPDGYLKCIRD